MDKDKLDRLVNEAEEDPNVIGLLLAGSRSKSKSTKHSDYDLELIVKDGFAEEYEEKYSSKGGEKFNFAVKSLSEFRNFATLEDEWNKPRYMHVEAFVDKNGEIQELINEKARIPEDKIKDYVYGKLDGYINYFYRSLKCIRNGNYIGARLEASKSIHIFLKVIFGIEGRVAPYYKYLKSELKDYPLKKFSMDPDEIINNLMQILDSADVEAQLKLFRAVKEACEDDYPDLIEEWEGKVQRILHQMEDE